MKRYLLILLALAALLPACNEDDNTPQEPAVVTDESYLTEVIMQHFAILDAQGELKCRTEYNIIDRNASDSTIVYGYVSNQVAARSIFCHLVAANTQKRIKANADSTTLTYEIAGNPRPLSFSISNRQGMVATIKLPYPDTYANIATKLVLMHGSLNNDEEDNGTNVEIKDYDNRDNNDSNH